MTFQDLVKVLKDFLQLLGFTSRGQTGAFTASEKLTVYPLPIVHSGCTDGLVGLAARVALVQIPWLVLEEEPSPDLTNHIAGLQSMLSELQQRVSHRHLLLEPLKHQNHVLL